MRAGLIPAMRLKMKSKLLMLHLWLLVAVLVCPPASGEVTTLGSVSNGKFYSYNLSPSSSYPDKWGNMRTAGIRLVDEVFAGGYPWNNWVGWFNPGSSVEITLNLGRTYGATAIRVHCASQTSGGGIYYPTQVRFYTRPTTNDVWVQWGTTINGPTNTSGYSTAWIAGNGNLCLRVSQVKFELAGSGRPVAFCG